jgi:hypothetical protein
MKSWISIPDASGDGCRAVSHKLAGFVARVLLFGSVFLIHPGERCASDIGRPPVLPEKAPSVAAPQPAAATAPVPDNRPLTC